MYRLLTTVYDLLKYRMAAALAVIGCLAVTLAVVVIEHEVLAFVTDDLRDAFEILCVLGDHERTRV